MKKKTSISPSHPTSESRQAWVGGVVTIIVSIFFLGLAYVLLNFGQSMWRAFGYVAIIWGIMGIGYGLREIHKAFRRR